MPQHTESTVRAARTADAPLLAEMLGAGLDSRLNDLGPWFSSFLHRHMVESEYCVCLVAERQERILGYGAAFTSTRTFYREFALRKGILAGLMVLPWILVPRNFHTVVRGFTYGKRSDHRDDPEAQMVSLIVSPEARGLGLGRKLFDSLNNALFERGIRSVKIPTAPDNAQANAMYLRHGCALVRTDELYKGATLNVYVCPLDEYGDETVTGEISRSTA